MHGRAAVQGVAGVGVAQPVGGDGGREAGPARRGHPAGTHCAYGRRSLSTPPPARGQTAAAQAGGSATWRVRPPLAVQGGRGRAVGPPRQVPPLQAQELGQARPGIVQKEQQGPVARALRAPAGRSQQVEHVPFRQDAFRQARGDAARARPPR